MKRPAQLAASLGCVLLAVTSCQARAQDLANEVSCRACDREMRKTIEALQAWRRLHNGRYPDRLVDLKSAGLMAENGAICPRVIDEDLGADPSHEKTTSRREGGDPPGTYEYELAAKVAEKIEVFEPTLHKELRTRQEYKLELLRRQYADQVPLLRCSSHRPASVDHDVSDKARRNATASGAVYWSGEDWEQNWLDDVPYCCREWNVLYGLKGPPFHSGIAPDLPTALDLRPWACAFGDQPWWWTAPAFMEHVAAPALRPLFSEQHGRIMELSGESWWIDGLVQLQGKIMRGALFSAPGIQAFVWEKKNLPVDRFVKSAAWLQGSIWSAKQGDEAGWLVWSYTDRTTVRVPITYGINTARFWTDGEQSRHETSFPSPVWQYHETADRVGEDRWLRIYRQQWENPKPEMKVDKLDFISNPECPASPFIIAINVFE